MCGLGLWKDGAGRGEVRGVRVEMLSQIAKPNHKVLSIFAYALRPVLLHNVIMYRPPSSCFVPARGWTGVLVVDGEVGLENTNRVQFAYPTATHKHNINLHTLFVPTSCPLLVLDHHVVVLQQRLLSPIFESCAILCQRGQFSCLLPESTTATAAWAASACLPPLPPSF